MKENIPDEKLFKWEKPEKRLLPAFSSVTFFLPFLLLVLLLLFFSSFTHAQFIFSINLIDVIFFVLSFLFLREISFFLFYFSNGKKPLLIFSPLPPRFPFTLKLMWKNIWMQRNPSPPPPTLSHSLSFPKNCNISFLSPAGHEKFQMRLVHYFFFFLHRRFETVMIFPPSNLYHILFPFDLTTP